LLRHVRKALGDDEADVVLEMSGATQAIAGAVDLCAVGGIIKLVGSALPVPAASWLPEQIVRKLIRIEGVHNYTPTQFQQAMRFMADHASDYPFDSLIPHTFPLREVQDAFEYAASSSAVRVAVTPSG
jgi:alcohol dehydrogenase